MVGQARDQPINVPYARLTFAHSGEIEFRVGGADAGFGEAQFAADDVGAFDQRHAFVIGDAAGQALAAEAAIGGDDQPLGRDVFERLPDQASDVLGRLDDGVGMADDADADLLVGLELAEQRQVPAVAGGAFEGDDVCTSNCRRCGRARS